MTKENILKKLLLFLYENKRWNSQFQFQEYRAAIATSNNQRERLLFLLYAIVNSQSQPQLESLAQFWEAFQNNYKEINPCIDGFVDFLNTNKKMVNNSATSFIETLYLKLKAQDGWGEKTAALFVKAVINIHCFEDKALHFFDEESILKIKNLRNERVYLPVDAVIKHIFNSIVPIKNQSFKSINQCVFDFFESEEFRTLNISPSLTRIEAMILFDDLWFWGFITQNSQGGKRKNKWNKEKFWSLKYLSKEKDDIQEIENKSKEFLRIINKTR